MLDKMINDHMAKDEAGVWSCTICSVANRQKARIRNHVETHFESTQMCPYCPQVYKSRDSLRKHLKGVHGTKFWFPKFCRPRQLGKLHVKNEGWHWNYCVFHLQLLPENYGKERPHEESHSDTFSSARCCLWTMWNHV